MEEYKLQDIIDDYLKGIITDPDRIWFEKQMSDDPDIARQVEQSREAYQFLQFAHYKNIRQKMSAYDLAEGWKPKRSFAKRAWKICLILLLPFSAFIGYALHQYNPARLAKKHYFIMHETLNNNSQSNMYIDELEKAHQVFLKGDYQLALHMHEALLDKSQIGYAEKTLWYILICKLALQGASDNWLHELDAFINIPGNPLRMNAVIIRREAGSIFCRIASLKFLSPVEALRPRLI